MKMKLHHHWTMEVIPRSFERKTSRLTVETELNLEGEEEIRKRYETVHRIIHQDNPETEYIHPACTHTRMHAHTNTHVHACTDTHMNGQAGRNRMYTYSMYTHTHVRMHSDYQAGASMHPHVHAHTHIERTFT